MKRGLGATIAFIVVAVGGIVLLNRADPEEGQGPALAGAPSAASAVVRGEYLARAADCVACHTVPGSAKPFSGGVAFKLPFGTIYSPNITADLATGIGRWTDDQFVRAVHAGIRNDGQPLYPAFPYTSYTQISRNDVLAIKAYLFSLPTIYQPSKEPDLAFPLNQRWAMGLWNAAFFKEKRFVAQLTHSPQWNNGAYLFGALGHCAECHTPRTFAFALQHRNELAGETIQGWKAPNISSDRIHGIGAWSDRELVDYLTTAHSDRHGSAGGPMAEVIANSLQFLRPQDIDALVAYLRDAPAKTTGPILVANADLPAGTIESNKSEPSGLRLFEGVCASCHAWSGLGQQTAYAALTGSRAVHDIEGTNITQMILRGVEMRINGADVSMPAFGAGYSDTEIAALANYVIAQFGSQTGVVTPEMVARQRKL